MAIVIFKLKEHGRDDEIYRPTPKTIERIFAEADEYGDSRFTALIDLAAAHWYGAHAFFWRDKGLYDEGIYGQICKPVPEKLGGGNSCVTGRVFIEMNVNGQDVCNRHELEEAIKQG